MLKAPAAFPYTGSTCYFDDQNADGQDVVEKARILRDNGDNTALIAIHSRRFPHEVASGNRTISFDQLRATEQASPEQQVTKRKARRRA